MGSSRPTAGASPPGPGRGRGPAFSNDKRWRFDLIADPRELLNLADPKAEPTRDLRTWLEFVDHGLRQSDRDPPEPLDEETIEQLRALGYAD